MNKILWSLFFFILLRSVDFLTGAVGYVNIIPALLSFSREIGILALARSDLGPFFVNKRDFTGSNIGTRAR